MTGALALFLLAASCMSDHNPSGPSSLAWTPVEGGNDFTTDRRPGRGPTSRLAVSPAGVTLAPSSSQIFSASLRLKRQESDSVAIRWTATGGTVDSNGMYTAGPALGSYRVIAHWSSLADTATVTIATVSPTPITLDLSPAIVSLSSGVQTQFTAVRKASDGTSLPVNPRYTATGGSVSSTGSYTAGSVPGTYQVVATDTSTGGTDTSTVTITSTAPVLDAVILTPVSLSLTSGAQQQFSAIGKMSDGSTSPVAVSWVVSGGTMSSPGLYTAGQTAGSYRVIATAVAGALADTAAVTITTSSTVPPALGVPILPGESIQAAVNAHGAGTAFLIKAGRHLRQSVVPKNGNVFRCEAGAVMDGENATAHAFASSGGNPDSVTIVGCRVRRYTPPAQQGAISASGSLPSQSTTGWVLDSVQADSNANGGIRMGHRMTVRRSAARWNSKIGITGVGDGLVVEATEIAWNNPSGTGLGFEAGGTKFALTNGLILRNNFVHHNKGPGLWTDIDNDGYLIEGNRVEDNMQEGIVTEISYSGVIRNNVVKRNGLGDSRSTSWLWGAGIGVHSSGGSGLEITGNTVEGNAHGIALIQQNRGSGSKGPYLVQNVWVHDNTVTQGATGATGAAQDVGSTAIFTSRNNRHGRNTYLVKTGNPRPFVWNDQWLQWSGWVAAGRDAGGSQTLVP
jgi:Right handed beta helix region